MPAFEAPSVELGSAPETPSVLASPSNSEVSSTSTPDIETIRATPLFRVLSMPPPEPDQPAGQEDLERRLPGYRRIVIPREMTLIELLRQSSGVATDEEVLMIREVKLRVIAERVGLRRLNVLAPNLRQLTLDGSVLPSLRDLGIGLAHLKVLSVNRCGLFSLDGVWGLSALRELYASGNRISDIQPVAALQKLHTLDLSKNRITESSRLWTLAVCTSLKKLVLDGNPMCTMRDYRSTVSSALPLLTVLDDRALNGDADEESESVFGAMSSSDSEQEDVPQQQYELPPSEPEPGPSESLEEIPIEGPDGDLTVSDTSAVVILRRRPATTEAVSSRPPRPKLRARPHTAAVQGDKREMPLTKLQVMNTLMDNEWRCSGSALTSHGAVCGNLARALRRPSQQKYEYSKDECDMMAATLADSTRAIAAEIPRAPRLEDWAKFKAETGIDINILQFNERPQPVDPTRAIERLEKIEKETLQRLQKKNQDFADYSVLHEDITMYKATDAMTFNKEITIDEDVEITISPNDNATLDTHCI